MEDDGEKKKAGRPKKSEGFRHAQTFRVDENDRNELVAAATAKQYSVSDEIEYRLTRYKDFARIFDGFFNDKASREFFNTLAAVIGRLRRRARENGMSEVETRAALKTAIDHIAEIFFWQGGEVSSAPEGYHREGALQNNPSPEIIGYSAASDHMHFESVYDRCDIMDDFCTNRIRNLWSGDGSISEEADQGFEESPPTRSLDEIMEEGHQRAAEKKAKAMKKKGVPDASS